MGSRLASAHRISTDSGTLSSRPKQGERPGFLDCWPPLAHLSLKAGKPLLVVFLRGFWCEYCKQQFAELAEQVSAFDAHGVQIIAITSDPEASPSDMTSKEAEPFHVLVDEGGALIRKLDLVDPFEFRPVPVSLPAVFLLDGAGIVRFHYVGRSPDDRPRIELLLLAAEHLSTGTS